MKKAAPRRVGRGAFADRTGKAADFPKAWARHSDAKGQRLHTGSRGVQTMDPRSIIAWAKSPQPSAGVMASAAARMLGFAAGNGASIAKSRATTRSTLPSTTTARRSKAMAAMAAAV